MQRGQRGNKVEGGVGGGEKDEKYEKDERRGERVKDGWVTMYPNLLHFTMDPGSPPLHLFQFFTFLPFCFLYALWCQTVLYVM